jgi:hypothetical protein
VVNPAVYLGGGDDFGALIPGTANIVSRNLTPDKTGMPEGAPRLTSFFRAIYEYLKAIPCISGPPAPSPLRNDCN